MVYDISLHPDFSCDDVSAAINSVVENLKEGDSAFLSFGSYKIADTLRIMNDSHLNHNSILLEGNYEVINHNLPVSVQIEGSHYKFELENITSNDKSDYYNLDENDTLPGGISIGETNFHATLKFGIVEGFEFGIRLYPESDYTGVNFASITFDKLTYCCTPILFDMPDDLYCWINENKFYGGTIKGNYGIYFKKGLNQLDSYNNNTFYNVAFEAIEKNAIVADFCTNNTFIAPRFEVVNKLTIKESETCSCNKYLISVSIPFCSIQLKSQYTDIDGPIFNNSWKIYLKKLYTDQYARLHGEFYSRSIQNADNTDKLLSDNIGIVYINSERSCVILTLADNTKLTDNRIRLIVSGYKNPISISDEERNIIIPEKIIEGGTYDLVYSEDHWNLIKISDTIPFVSGQTV